MESEGLPSRKQDGNVGPGMEQWYVSIILTKIWVIAGSCEISTEVPQTLNIKLLLI